MSTRAEVRLYRKSLTSSSTLGSPPPQMPTPVPEARQAACLLRLTAARRAHFPVARNAKCLFSPGCVIVIVSHFCLPPSRFRHSLSYRTTCVHSTEIFPCCSAERMPCATFHFISSAAGLSREAVFVDSHALITSAGALAFQKWIMMVCHLLVLSRTILEGELHFPAWSLSSRSMVNVAKAWPADG